MEKLVTSDLHGKNPENLVLFTVVCSFTIPIKLKIVQIVVKCFNVNHYKKFINSETPFK